MPTYATLMSNQWKKIPHYDKGMDGTEPFDGRGYILWLETGDYPAPVIGWHNGLGWESPLEFFEKNSLQIKTIWTSGINFYQDLPEPPEKKDHE